MYIHIIWVSTLWAPLWTYNMHTHTFFRNYIKGHWALIAWYNIHTYICIYIPTYIHTYIHTYMHACMHTYIYTHIHSYIHACVHAYIQTHTHIMWVSTQTMGTTTKVWNTCSSGFHCNYIKGCQAVIAQCTVHKYTLFRFQQ